MAILMILGTFSAMLPPAHAAVNPITATPTNGAPGSTVSVLPAAVALNTFTPLRSAFGMFDTEVADADVGLPLFGFTTLGAAGDEQYRNINGVAGYQAGEPIYRIMSLPLLAVKPGDIRLTAVTIGATVYAAGSTVAVGNLDIAAVTIAMPANIHHTGAAVFAIGNEIVDDVDANNIVTSGDQRLNYPSVTVTNAAGTYSYAVNTIVRPSIFDYQEGLYQDLDGNNVVSLGDSRRRQYVASAVTYPHGLATAAGDRDVVAVSALLAFTTAYLVLDEVYVDLDGNLAYTFGEPVYTVAGVTWLVAAGDTRQSFVTVGAAFYLPGSLVAAGDLDIGMGYRHFAGAETYHDMDASATFTPRDWIYFDTDASATVTVGDVRLSNIPISETWGAAGTPLPVTRQAQAQIFDIGLANVALHDAEVGIALVAIPATWHYVGAAYAPNSPMYIDNDGDNLVSVGDTRLTVVSTGIGYPPYAGMPVAAPGAWFMPGSVVAAGDAGIGAALNFFGFAAGDPDHFSENILVDGVYSTELMGHYNSDAAGFMGPFPVPLAARVNHVAMTFTIPTQTPVGNHVILLCTDAPPGVGFVAPFDDIGFLDSGALAYPIGGAKNAMTSLPWTDGGAATRRWAWGDMGITAGPAFFVIPKVCGVQMSPGTYAHTLGTPASIVELDYTKGSIIQNVTGDISLNITLCGKASSISVYIPPEFTFLQPDTRSVWTSITNDYKRVSMAKRSSADPIGPMWWNLRIVNSTIPIGSYVVRMFNVRAPDVCGRYFVKVFVDGESIGSENFPTIVVKGNLDPAYISGRVLNGDHGSYGVPVSVSGEVIAEGKTAQGTSVKAQAYFNASASGAYILYGLAAGTYNLTASAAGFAPTTMSGTVTVYAGQSLHGIDLYVYPSATIFGTICSKCGAGEIPWGSAHNRTISMEILDSNLESKAWFATNKTDYDPSQAYYQFSFNGSIELDGHVPQDYAGYVSGLESGDYYLKAYVNGYLQRDVVKVHVYDYTRSVSVPFDLWRSGQFNVTVHFLSPTPKSGRLTLEAYPLDGTISGSNTTIVPAGTSDWAMTITGKRDYGLPSGTYFIEADFPGYSQTTLPQATIGGGCSTTSLSFDMVRGGALNLTLRSVNWQAPPQRIPWEYPNATIRIEAIDSTGQVYVATAKQRPDPTDLTKTNATITGLPTDTYLVRVYTVGYIQTMDYRVSVSSVGTSDMTVYLVEATRLNLAFEFRKEGLVADIDTYERYNLTEVPARIEVYDSLGVLVGANTTYIPHEGSTSPVQVVGFRSYAGNPCLRWINYYDTTDGSLQKDYGLPPGTYQVLVWVPGYAQAQTAILSTTPGSTAGITISLDRLAHVNGTISGLDMHEDLIPLSWATVTAYGPILTATSSLDGIYEMWIVNGTYALGVSSPGYETQGVEIQVSMAWETPVDFDLRPPSGAIPELSATELMLGAVLVIACASLRRSPPAS